jgi:FkbM family methyltransferase
MVRRAASFDIVSRSRIRRIPVECLGSRECGWHVPLDLPARGDVCFCLGAGEDITFDIVLHRQRGCTVHTFDPTPRAVGHYQKLSDADRAAIRFHPVGIWTEDGIKDFYAPADDDHVSHSLVLQRSTRVGFSAECLRFSSLLARVGGDPPRLVKMDVEGAEMHVIGPMIEDHRPDILLVEFDELNPLTETSQWARVRGLIRSIQRRGYSLYSAIGANYGFVRRGAGARGAA